MSILSLHNPAHEVKTLYAASRIPGTGRSIRSWHRSNCKRKTPPHARFPPHQSGGILAETRRSRSGVARIGIATVGDLEMWLGAQNPDCCDGALRERDGKT